MSFKIRQKKNADHHIATSFTSLGKKTKEVAARSTGFFVYPKLVTLMLLVTLGLLITRIYFSNQLAVSGSRVSIFEDKASTLEAENFQIENKISQKSSLLFIENKAKELGMVKINKLEVVKSLTPVALRP